MSLAEELGVSRTTVHELRKELQANARRLQPEEPLVDEHTETDEMFQNAGEKRSASSRPRGSAQAPRQQAARAR